MALQTTQEKLAVYTSEQVRELDRIAIEDFNLPGYVLMTRAAQATFSYINEYFSGSISLTKICVMCGPGNNGGDGYVLARLFKEAGRQATVITAGSVDQLTGDALQAYQDWIAAGGCVEKAGSEVLAQIEADLLVDALLGTGLQREITGQYARLIQWANQRSVPLVAMDIPSGLHADTGQVMGCAIKAALTVTYIGMKQGLLTGQARDYCGKLTFASLDVPSAAYARLSVSQYTLVWHEIAALLPPRQRCAHKGNFGHALLVGGNQGMSGAIQLAGEAALRCGSGRVTLATHPEHAAWLNLGRPELMVKAVASSQQLRGILAEKQALGIGPGLGQDDWALQLLLMGLEAGCPMVVDADALNLLAGRKRQQDNWILTPHPGEAGRLLGCSAGEIEQNRVSAVRRIQQQYGGVVVLKGAGTLIAAPDSITFSTEGNPGMASGGMGDTLTGIITALLAQGLAVDKAAQAGVMIHARAADAAAQQGERGLLASDVLQQLRAQVNP